MKRRFLWIVLANILAVTGLIGAYPHLMISPGPMLAGHQAIETDCLQCHQAFQGTPAIQCQTCHKLENIGRFDTQGKPLTQPSTKLAFHKQLQNQACTECHQEHQGPQALQGPRVFAHTLLPTPLQQDCLSCHQAPHDEKHLTYGKLCAECHSTENWSAVQVNHASFLKAGKKECVACHQAPKDQFHQAQMGDCAQCHAVEHWKPSTFDHARYFRFDRHHPADCQTCHLQQNYQRYTCEECHSRSSIQGEHEEEGIQIQENCAECHRDGNEESASREVRSGSARSFENGSRSKQGNEHFSEHSRKEKEEHEEDD